jgi:protein-S-isoprenylcysteine O-methyltransferase Ste14
MLTGTNLFGRDTAKVQVSRMLSVEVSSLVFGLLWILPNLFWLGYFLVAGSVVRFHDVSVKRLNLVALSRVIFVPLNLFALPVITAMVHGFSLSLWLGVSCLVFGFLVAVYGIYLLVGTRSKVKEVLGGGKLSPKSLVTDGPYGIVRHPMYSAFLFITLGLTVALPLFYNLVNLALASICVFLYTALLEEPLTLKIFGRKYLEYVKKVPHRFLTWKRGVLILGCILAILANYIPNFASF